MFGGGPFGGGQGFGGAARGLEVFEIAEGSVVGALGGIDAALEDGEVLLAADEGQAHAVGVVAHAVVFGFVGPEFGVGEGITAKEPVGVDEGSDEERLLGCGGVCAV